uniref:Uncharacterized protein n=1 Tax=Rangifer tarandus platyrhynchus TaxID=3082113 RepID=A0ACB0EEM1_RANTA|nr:unnamed protein product [Rangifer tarandus platyrhynchus]
MGDETRSGKEEGATVKEMGKMTAAQGARASPSGSQHRPRRAGCLKLPGKRPSGLRVRGHGRLTKHALTLTGVTRSP